MMEFGARGIWLSWNLALVYSDPELLTICYHHHFRLPRRLKYQAQVCLSVCLGLSVLTFYERSSVSLPQCRSLYPQHLSRCQTSTFKGMSTYDPLHPIFSFLYHRSSATLQTIPLSSSQPAITPPPCGQPRNVKAEYTMSSSTFFTCLLLSRSSFSSKSSSVPMCPPCAQPRMSTSSVATNVSPSSTVPEGYLVVMRYNGRG
jgi:hypothetical protein